MIGPGPGFFAYYDFQFFFKGWEYTVEASYGSRDYEAMEKIFHFCRRKRWIRERVVIDSTEVKKELKVITHSFKMAPQ